MATKNIGQNCFINNSSVNGDQTFEDMKSFVEGVTGVVAGSFVLKDPTYIMGQLYCSRFKYTTDGAYVPSSASVIMTAIHSWPGTQHGKGVIDFTPTPEALFIGSTGPTPSIEALAPTTMGGQAVQNLICNYANTDGRQINFYDNPIIGRISGNIGSFPKAAPVLLQELLGANPDPVNLDCVVWRVENGEVGAGGQTFDILGGDLVVNANGVANPSDAGSTIAVPAPGAGGQNFTTYYQDKDGVLYLRSQTGTGIAAQIPRRSFGAAVAAQPTGI